MGAVNRKTGTRALWPPPQDAWPVRSFQKSSENRGREGDGAALMNAEKGWIESMRCDTTADRHYLLIPTRCNPMLAAPARDWNIFKQIFADH